MPNGVTHIKLTPVIAAWHSFLAIAWFLALPTSCNIWFKFWSQKLKPNNIIGIWRQIHTLITHHTKMHSSVTLHSLYVSSFWKQYYNPHSSLSAEVIMSHFSIWGTFAHAHPAPVTQFILPLHWTMTLHIECLVHSSVMVLQVGILKLQPGIFNKLEQWKETMH